MNRQTIIGILIAFLLLGCAHGNRLRKNAPAPKPVTIQAAANRLYSSPWPNQESFGYREWFKSETSSVADTIRIQDIPFRLKRDGKVIGIEPGKDAVIEIERPVPASEIALLVSASFVNGGERKFTVETETVEGRKGTIVLSAHDWIVRPTDSMAGKSVRFPIEADGGMSTGQVELLRAPVLGKIKRIRIVNDSADPRQHLLVAATTLLP